MENHKLYKKIAYWYYKLGLTQDEIAKRLSLTRQKVNQIINSLIELGVVSIVINGYEDHDAFLENYLEETYQLKQAIVVNAYEEEDEERIFKGVTEAAARHLERIIQKKSIIGVSWGIALTSAIGQMRTKRRPECKVVQMIGAQDTSEAAMRTDEIARLLADKLDCPSYMLYAPVIVDNPETKTALLNEKYIQRIFDYIRSCDIAIVGIGELTEGATICKRGLLSIEDIHALRGQGFCADICFNAVSPNGSGENSCISDRVIGADLNILRKIPNVVAIVAGMEKKDAVEGALRSGCIDTLIIDARIVEYIYKKNTEKKT
ncbi:MAG: sugar-binding transcriptional regulator [Eubacteriales bacterium]|nr:sugar-binding transcriptional regulator [Eubacteriales bacterium]